MRAVSAQTTSDANPVTLFDFAGLYAATGYIYNKGTTDGKFQINLKGDWADILAGSSVTIKEAFTILQVKRNSGDLSGIGAMAFGV